MSLGALLLLLLHGANGNMIVQTSVLFQESNRGIHGTDKIAST